MIWLPPDKEMLLTLSAIFSTYSIFFNLNNMALSSISLAVFRKLLAEARLIMDLAPGRLKRSVVSRLKKTIALYKGTVPIQENKTGID